jgi:hypothetical protein
MIRRTIILATVAALAAACGDGSGPASAPRTFLMGFSAIPPRLDSTADVIIAINNWAPHADAAIMHVSPPWAAMLGGATPDSVYQAVVRMTNAVAESARRRQPLRLAV